MRATSTRPGRKLSSLEVSRCTFPSLPLVVASSAYITLLPYLTFSTFHLAFRLSRLNTEVTRITSRSSSQVSLYTRPRRQQPDLHNPGGEDEKPGGPDSDLPETLEEYDEIVLCVLADTAKRLLGKTAGWFERLILGNTKWSDDITVSCSSSLYFALSIQSTNSSHPVRIIRSPTTSVLRLSPSPFKPSNFQTAPPLLTRISCFFLPPGRRLYPKILHHGVRRGSSRPHPRRPRREREDQDGQGVL